MKCRTQYPSDLTGRQWQLIRQLLSKRARRGRRRIDRRWVINAILFVVRQGCQWRMLPSDFPNWSTVYGIFWNWRNDGTWQKVHDALREKVRRAAGKKSTPTVAIIDSQSVRTAEGSDQRGYDAGKKPPAASGTWRWIRSVWYWRSWFMEQGGKITTALVSC